MKKFRYKQLFCSLGSKARIFSSEWVDAWLVHEYAVFDSVAWRPRFSSCVRIWPTAPDNAAGSRFSVFAWNWRGNFEVKVCVHELFEKRTTAPWYDKVVRAWKFVSVHRQVQQSAHTCRPDAWSSSGTDPLEWETGSFHTWGGGVGERVRVTTKASSRCWLSTSPAEPWEAAEPIYSPLAAAGRTQQNSPSSYISHGSPNSLPDIMLQKSLCCVFCDETSVIYV